MFEKEHLYTCEEIIKLLMDEYLTKNKDEFLYSQKLAGEPCWNIYLEEDEVTLNTICYVDAQQDIDDDTDEEIFPAFIVKNFNIEALNYWRDEIITDVICVVFNQLSKPSTQNVLDSILYYMKFDCFKEF